MSPGHDELEIHPRRSPRTAQALPTCGEGPLFSGWSNLQCCSICGLIFVTNPGDTWAFTIIGDRLPIAGIIVLIDFGVMRSHPVLGLTLVVVLVALLIWTPPIAGAQVSRCITCRECMARTRGSYPASPPTGPSRNQP